MNRGIRIVLCGIQTGEMLFECQHDHDHHQLIVHFLPRLIKGMNGCFPTALGRQCSSNVLNVTRKLNNDNSIFTTEDFFDCAQWKCTLMKSRLTVVSGEVISSY